MKKALIILHVILIMMLVVACNGNGEANETELQTDAAGVQATETIATTEEKATPEPSEEEADVQEQQTDAVDEQKVMEYLAILGLDDNAEYIVLDQFPIEGSDEKSILMDVNGMPQDCFDTVIQAMETNGCYLVSDIMTDEERNTKAFQYRNADDSLYIEMVYSIDAQYITIMFAPLN